MGLHFSTLFCSFEFPVGQVLLVYDSKIVQRENTMYIFHPLSGATKMEIIPVSRIYELD